MYMYVRFNCILNAAVTVSRYKKKKGRRKRRRYARTKEERENEIYFVVYHKSQRSDFGEKT